MKVKGRFDHFNINVTDLDKSIKFYETALGLHESHRCLLYTSPSPRDTR